MTSNDKPSNSSNGTAQKQSTSEHKLSISEHKQPSPLDSAPDEIKLAVDLIYLFESHHIQPDVALKALEIVKTDLMKQV